MKPADATARGWVTGSDDEWRPHDSSPRTIFHLRASTATDAGVSAETAIRPRHLGVHHRGDSPGRGEPRRRRLPLPRPRRPRETRTQHLLLPPAVHLRGTRPDAGGPRRLRGDLRQTERVGHQEEPRALRGDDSRRDRLRLHRRDERAGEPWPARLREGGQKSRGLPRGPGGRPPDRGGQGHLRPARRVPTDAPAGRARFSRGLRPAHPRP